VSPAGCHLPIWASPKWGGSSGEEPSAFPLDQRVQPNFERLHACKAVRVFVHHQPERACYAPLGQHGHQPCVSIADKAGQHADPGTGCDQAVLRVDRGGADCRGEAGLDFGQIAQFGRIEQIGDIADQRMPARQITCAAQRRGGLRDIQARRRAAARSRTACRRSPARRAGGERDGQVRLALRRAEEAR